MLILDYSYLRYRCISIDINLDNYTQGTKVGSTSHEIKSREMSAVEDSDREPAVEILVF